MESKVLDRINDAIDALNRLITNTDDPKYKRELSQEKEFLFYLLSGKRPNRVSGWFWVV